MDDDAKDDLSFRPRPTPQRPLLGLTVLVVEDSRFASEALRLLCLRSGARIRRADSLASAERHLTVYRPSVAIVDLGLPDGSGLDLIRRLDAARPRVPVLLGTSGAERDAAAKESAGAGADGFLPKPMESLAAFQAAILGHLPEELRPNRPRPVDSTEVHPDELAYREDLSHAAALLDTDTPPVGYLRPFLIGIARVAHDEALERQAAQLAAGLSANDRAALRDMITDRISRVASV
ncbi:response regulator [Rhodobacterales bacterium HKCCE2091]|nr:response regulator [Rhodobacterales bacterium HKCCE2091]